MKTCISDILETFIYGLNSPDPDGGHHHVEIDICGSENSLLELAELIRAVATAGKHGAHQHVRREGVDIPRLKGDVAITYVNIAEANHSLTSGN